MMEQYQATPVFRDYEPFPGTTFEDHFFIPPSRRRVITTLIDSIHMLGGLQCVVGEKGSGKTTLAQQMHGVLQVGGRRAVLISVTTDQGQDLAAAIIARLVSPYRGEASGMANLKRFYRICHQRQERSVVILDDAHNLSKAALAMVLELSSWGDGAEKWIQVILFGLPGLSGKMAQLVPIATGAGLGNAQCIKPFTHSELKYYVAFKLENLQGTAEFDHPNDFIDQLLDFTKGLPGQVDVFLDQFAAARESDNRSQVMEQALAGVTRELKTARKSIFRSFSRWLLKPLMPVTLGMVFLLLYFIPIPQPVTVTFPVVKQVLPPAAKPTTPLTENPALEATREPLTPRKAKWGESLLLPPIVRISEGFFAGKRKKDDPQHDLVN